MTGRKKRDTFDVRENLYNLRNKLIRTGRNDDETTMSREAVDHAIDKIIEDGIDERDTDIEAINRKTGHKTRIQFRDTDYGVDVSPRLFEQNALKRGY